MEQFLKGRPVCVREPFLGRDNLLECDKLLVLNTFSIMGKDMEERVSGLRSISMCTAKVNYVLKPLMDVMGQSYVLNRSYSQICGKTTISSEILYNTIWNY